MNCWSRKKVLWLGISGLLWATCIHNAWSSQIRGAVSNEHVVRMNPIPFYTNLWIYICRNQLHSLRNADDVDAAKSLQWRGFWYESKEWELINTFLLQIIPTCSKDHCILCFSLDVPLFVFPFIIPCRTFSLFGLDKERSNIMHCSWRTEHRNY